MIRIVFGTMIIASCVAYLVWHATNNMPWHYWVWLPLAILSGSGLAMLFWIPLTKLWDDISYGMDADLSSSDTPSVHSVDDGNSD